MTNAQSKINLCSQNFPFAFNIPEPIKQKLLSLHKREISRKTRSAIKTSKTEIGYNFIMGLYFIRQTVNNKVTCLYENGLCTN